MNIKDGRGLHNKSIAEENKTAIKTWFRANPGSTITECCESLGLTYITVRKHLDALKNEK